MLFFVIDIKGCYKIPHHPMEIPQCIYSICTSMFLASPYDPITSFPLVPLISVEGV